MCVWIESSIVSAVFIWPDRCCWFRCLTDVMTNWRGGWRQTLKRWEAALHKSIWASDSSAPGGPDNCRAARQHRGFGAKTVEKWCGRDKLPCITNIFNPLLAGAQPQDPHNQTEHYRGPWDFKHPPWILYLTDLFMLYWPDSLTFNSGYSLCLPKSGGWVTLNMGDEWVTDINAASNDYFHHKLISIIFWICQLIV